MVDRHVLTRLIRTSPWQPKVVQSLSILSYGEGLQNRRMPLSNDTKGLSKLLFVPTLEQALTRRYVHPQAATRCGGMFADRL